MVILLIPSSTASAQAPGDIEWIRQFGSGGPARDSAQAVDANGNVYVAGQTDGTLPGQTRAGSDDAFVRKYDSAGTELWTRQFGTSRLDGARGVSVDSSGVYVAGFTNGTLPGQSSAGNHDAFVRKYDLAGNEVWTRQFGSSSVDLPLGVSVDSSGVYVVGWTTGALPGQTSAGSRDTFVRKYDLAGTEVWTRQFGSSSVDQAFGVSVDSSGVYVAGSTSGTLPGQSSAGSTDAFVRKYDSAGTEVWTRQFGSSSFDLALGVSADSSGVYVAGQTSGTLPGQTSAGGRDAFVRKYDSAGTEVWTRQFGTSSFDQARGVSVDSSGVYVAGFTIGTLPGQTSAGGGDAFVRKYDSTGTEVWTRQFGSSSSDQALGVSVDSSGVYVAGQTGSFFRDAFVRKYDSAGTELWTRQFGAVGPAFDVAQAVDANGNVYVAGQTGGTLPGQSSAGSRDAFVRKYDSAGTEVWTRQFGSYSFDGARGVSVDSSGVYVAGFTIGTLPGQTSAGGRDAFVRKYDSAGTELWTRQFGSSSFDEALGVSVDSSGVYVAGQTRGTLPGQTSSGGRDAFVRKYDSAGTEVWTRQFGTFAVDQASGVSVDSSGVYVAGFTGGTLPGQSSAGFTDAFVRKYDLAGTEVWTRQFGSPSLDEARGVSVDSSGVYVAGQTRSTLPGQTSAGSIDAFVVKLRGDNTPPTANAGLDQTVEWTGDPVILNGVQSRDPDPGDTLTFSWSFSSLPVGSIATLTSAASANPSFTPDELGDYVVELTVTDGTVNSESDSVTITVQDTTAPTPSVALVPVPNEEDESEFTAVYSCNDACDTSPQTTGVIVTPSLAGLVVELEDDDEAKVEFDLAEGILKIHGPSPQALLDQLQAGGLNVANGQVLEIEIDEDD